MNLNYLKSNTLAPFYTHYPMLWTLKRPAVRAWVLAVPSRELLKHVTSERLFDPMGQFHRPCRPWLILKMAIRFPRIRRGVREKTKLFEGDLRRWLTCLSLKRKPNRVWPLLLLLMFFWGLLAVLSCDKDYSILPLVLAPWNMHFNVNIILYHSGKLRQAMLKGSHIDINEY